MRDTISVCRFYSRRIDFREKYGEAPSKDHLESFTQSEASKPSKGPKFDDQSKSSFPFDDEEDKSLTDIDNTSIASVSQYQTKQSLYNNLEDSISLTEKTSKKLLPIYQEVLRKVSQIEKKRD